MLRAILQRPELSLQESSVAEDDFDHPIAQRIFGRIRSTVKEAEEGQATLRGSGALLSALSPEDASLAGSILVQDVGVEDPEAVLKKLVEERRLVKRYKLLQSQVAEIQHGKAPADSEALQEYQRLLKRLSDLQLLDRI